MKIVICTILASMLFICNSVYAGKGGVGAIFGALIGGTAGNAIGKSSSQKVTIDEAIFKMANEMNKQLPMVVDQDTRWDSISPAVGHQFTYNFTFINLQSKEFDRAAWHRESSPVLQKRICTIGEMEIFFKNGVSISYSYHGKDGGHVGKVTISPSDCGYKS